MTKQTLDKLYTPNLLSMIYNKLATESSTTYRKLFGVGLMDCRIIALLAAEPNITATRIAEITNLDKSAVSRSIKSLSEKGIVTGTVQSDTDRSPALYLSDTGRALHAKYLPYALSQEQRLLSCLSDQESIQFQNYLVRVLERLTNEPS